MRRITCAGVLSREAARRGQRERAAPPFQTALVAVAAAVLIAMPSVCEQRRPWNDRNGATMASQNTKCRFQSHLCGHGRSRRRQPGAAQRHSARRRADTVAVFRFIFFRPVRPGSKAPVCCFTSLDLAGDVERKQLQLLASRARGERPDRLEQDERDIRATLREPAHRADRTRCDSPSRTSGAGPVLILLQMQRPLPRRSRARCRKSASSPCSLSAAPNSLAPLGSQ
jgi:hypothetical protein